MSQFAWSVLRSNSGVRCRGRKCYVCRSPSVFPGSLGFVQHLEKSLNSPVKEIKPECRFYKALSVSSLSCQTGTDGGRTLTFHVGENVPVLTLAPNVEL